MNSTTRLSIEDRRHLKGKRLGTNYGAVRIATRTSKRRMSNANCDCPDPDMPVSEAGIAALNKTGQADFVEREGSDPNAPEYAAIVHVFHQLHCLVSHVYQCHRMPALCINKLRTQYENTPGF